jgi:hypothetical protein
MIALGLRVVLRGGRESAVRIAAISAGVAVGVVLILLAIATLNGLHARDLHSAWLATSTHNRQPSTTSPASDGTLWRKTSDQFGSQSIARVDVAATGPSSPVPPGIPTLPAAGQFYASPALTQLLRATPADQLRNRFPGHLVGTIARAGLPSPHALIIVIGEDRAHLATQPGVITVRSIETAPTQHTYTTFQAVALGVGAAGLLVPVLISVGMATRIAAARREQRLAAMRLVGATVTQVATLAAIEAASAALIGTATGIGLFYALRATLAGIQLTGDSWFTNDLSLGWLALTLTVVAVPLAAAAAAVGALTRVRVSPLGVTRRATPVAPKATRLIPLGLGVLLLSVFALAGHPYSRGASSTYAPTIVVAFTLIIVGIVVAGPWLTRAFTRLLAIRSARPATLIASRRLADDPAAAFRAVSGLILAVFVGSVFAGGAATASSPTSLGDDPGAESTVITRPTATALLAAVADRITMQLRSLHGVTAVTMIHADPRGNANGFPQGLIGCADLTVTPEIGRCAASGVISLPLYALDAGHSQPNTIWPAATDLHTTITALPVQGIVIATDAAPATLERIRTTIETAARTALSVPKTLSQLSAATLRDVTQLQHLADLAILLSVLIAGCSLTVAVVGSLIERQRPFSQLRLNGTPLKVLRRVVLLEAAVPLTGLAVVSAAGGLLTATLLLRAVRGTTIHLPGSPYYLTVLAGLVVALAFVGATMPLLHRVSSPENLHTE